VGTYEADLIVDGEAVASKRATIEPGEFKTRSFDRRFDEPGEYEIAVGDTSLGTLTVTADSDDTTATTQADQTGAEAPAIEVVSATVPADWVREGFDTTVRATVVNRLDRRANRTLAVTVDDERVGNETVTLQPNQREEVSIEFEAASGTVAVEGVDAGRIEVRETRTPVGTTTTDTPGGTGAGFGLVLTILVVAAVVLGRAAVREPRQ